MGNAIRYVKSGDKIVVSLAERGGRLLLTVADNGPGISYSRRELVFERFHRGADHASPGSVHIEDGLDGKGDNLSSVCPLSQRQ